MMKVYSVPKDDSKKEKAKCWIKNRMVDAKCFWAENKKEICVIAPVVVSGITIAVKTIGKRANLHTEKKLKDLRVYDTRLGHYWDLKRKLTNSEWVEVEKRWNAGEGYGTIFEEMNVLKR